MTEIDHRIRGFIGENFLFGEDANRLGADESLVQQGIIDSTGVLELVTFLEADFQVKIADDELVPQNLDTIHNLVAFIERKLAAATQLA
ncbi:MAG: acyl carrier protein [Planctomycetaceae bacterium]